MLLKRRHDVIVESSKQVCLMLPPCSDRQNAIEAHFFSAGKFHSNPIVNWLSGNGFPTPLVSFWGEGRVTPTQHTGTGRGESTNNMQIRANTHFISIKVVHVWHSFSKTQSWLKVRHSQINLFMSTWVSIHSSWKRIYSSCLFIVEKISLWCLKLISI